MTTKTQTLVREDNGTAGIFAALLAGFALLFVAGISQAAVLHDAAHDQRHAVAFPCH